MTISVFHDCAVYRVYTWHYYLMSNLQDLSAFTTAEKPPTSFLAFTRDPTKHRKGQMTSN